MNSDIVEDLKTAIVADKNPWDNTLYSRAIDKILQTERFADGWQETAAGLAHDLSSVEDDLERLLALGDNLVAVLRSGSDCGWDNAIDAWENFRQRFSDM